MPAVAGRLLRLGDKNKRSTRPNCAVQCGKFIIFDRNYCSKMFPEKIRVLPQTFLNTQENYALFFQVLLDAVINHFGFVLCSNACQEFSLRFRDAQFIKGILNRFRNIIPGLTLIRCRFYIIINIIQIQVGKVGSPFGIGRFSK